MFAFVRAFFFLSRITNITNVRERRERKQSSGIRAVNICTSLPTPGNVTRVSIPSCRLKTDECKLLHGRRMSCIGTTLHVSSQVYKLICQKTNSGKRVFLVRPIIFRGRESETCALPFARTKRESVPSLLSLWHRDQSLPVWLDDNALPSVRPLALNHRMACDRQSCPFIFASRRK